MFETFLPQLLLYPNPTDPLNGEAAALLMREPEAYAAKVRDYVARYARREDVERRGGAGGSGRAEAGGDPPAAADGAGDDADAMSGSGFLSSSDDDGEDEDVGGS